MTAPTKSKRLKLSNISVPAVVGSILLILCIVVAVFAPQIAPYDPAAANLAFRLQPPSWIGGEGSFLLGTDQLGRDILSRIIHGTRIALMVGISAVALAAIIGISLGLAAGYFGGWIDRIIMRVVDVLISIPNILLYLTVLGVFGPSLVTLCLVIGFINWTTFARVVRGEVLSVKRREYVEASQASGQRTLTLLVRHILPNIMAPLLVVVTLNVASIIVLEASLSFLGLGVQPPTVTWGRMLAEGRSYVSTAWWLATFPGLAITTLGLSLIFVGDWLRDVLDPRR